jgi:hypothetical protein
MERRPAHFGEEPLKVEDEYDDERMEVLSHSWMLDLRLMRFAMGRKGSLDFPSAARLGIFESDVIPAKAGIQGPSTLAGFRLPPE